MAYSLWGRKIPERGEFWGEHAVGSELEEGGISLKIIATLLPRFYYQSEDE